MIDKIFKMIERKHTKVMNRIDNITNKNSRILIRAIYFALIFAIFFIIFYLIVSGILATLKFMFGHTFFASIMIIFILLIFSSVYYESERENVKNEQKTVSEYMGYYNPNKNRSEQVIYGIESNEDAEDEENSDN